MRYQLAVVMQEGEYMKRLADYVRDSPFSESWGVSAFTSADACKQYIERGYAVHLVAAEPELLEELEHVIAAIPAVALVEKLGESCALRELLKYQSLPMLLKGLTEWYGRSIGNPVRSAAAASGQADSCGVITVCSSAGGVGKTAVALHLAHAAGTRGLRTFYLNLERWNTSMRWLGTEGAEGEGMSELLYEIKAKFSTARQWLVRHRQYHPLLKTDYVSAFNNVEDRLTLTSEDASALLELIAGTGEYDVIVVDGDDSWDDMRAALMERSRHMLMVLTEDPVVTGKHDLAMTYARQRWGERLQAMQDKIKLVYNKSSGMQLRVRHAYGLPFVHEWQAGGTLLSSPQFRAAADKLLEQLLESDCAHVR
ncbi:hypothetical protein M6D81_19655 [Paenibacillus sp. J5C_2022]|uniref:hypothetical protein n=1 Tax=Paenibacillus sp. J5C2022 TaxID=2977129 RepID=UPI0021D374B0|nr:hypothetical protein [Paenibacillus sp. J5C2022]MCU6710915.1 hypothetical protein [Paenibacillus sp. J5C2022]